jgi:YHS domain-containing protein
MSGLLSFLIFGVLFFFMMRFGCGAHAGHGGHGDHEGHAGSSGPGTAPGGPGQRPLASSVDPVCGMKVEADMGYLKMYRGAAYRFCSRDCLDKFEAEPDRYVGASSPAPGQGR